MAEQARFLLHPGYPKCGSTSLQKGFFARHEGLNALDGNPETQNSDGGNLYRALRFGAEKGQIERLFTDVLSPQIEAGQTANRINVFSAESLLMGSRNWRSVLQDLALLFPGATVLVIVRPQIEILRSWYDMEPYATLDAKRRFLPFSDWLVEALTPGAPRFNHDFSHAARFVEVISAYRETFGDNNVFVYSMSRFFEDVPARDVLLERLNLDPKSATLLLQRGRFNSHSNYRFRKIARRFLGPFRASSFLSREQIFWLGQQINRVTSDRPTVPSKADRALVERIFKEQNIAALAAKGWPGVFV